MSYAAEIVPAASDYLDSLPDPLQRFIRRGIAHLCLAPTRLSKPLSPHIGKGQLYELRYDAMGAVIYVSILFQYGSDEQTLWIERILTEFG